MHDIKINSVTGSEIVTTQNVKDFVRVDTSDCSTCFSQCKSNGKSYFQCLQPCEQFC